MNGGEGVARGQGQVYIGGESNSALPSCPCLLVHSAAAAAAATAASNSVHLRRHFPARRNKLSRPPNRPAGLLRKLVAMDAVALKNQLNAHVADMYAKGSVDEQFQQLQMLQDEGPSFVAEIINLYINDAEKILGNIAALLAQPVVDFDKVDGFVHQLKGSSASMGAAKVKLMCEQFRQFFDVKSREGCLMALTIVRNEFYDVRNKFQTMIQLEEQIEAYAPKQ